MNKNNDENRRRGAKSTRSAVSGGRTAKDRQEKHLSDDTSPDELEVEDELVLDPALEPLSPNGEGRRFVELGSEILQKGLAPKR